MDVINFLSTVEFHSLIYPGVRFVLRKPSVGVRIAIQRRIDEAKGDLEWRNTLRALWNELVKDFNVAIDGEKPNVDALFLNGAEDLVDEVCTELLRLTQPLGTEDEVDQRLIDNCRRQIAEAEERIAKRKNSEPQSSASILAIEPGTAASAEAVIPRPGGSGPSAIVTEAQNSAALSNALASTGVPIATG